MPSALALSKQLNSSLKLVSPIALVVSGTSGIGAAIALKIAQYSTSPTVHLVGRSLSSAEQIISQMAHINPSGHYEFHKCDVSLLSELKPLVRTLQERFPSISHLVISAGISSFKGRMETTEGNDIKMMLHYYSRFLIIRDLMSSLEAGHAKAMSVLDSLRGNPRNLDWDDLDLRKGYSTLSVRNHTVTMNDIAMQDFARKYPNVSFIHVNPGPVRTNINRSHPAYIALPSKVLTTIFAVEASDAGEICLAGMHSRRSQGQGQAFFMDQYGEHVKGKVLAKEEEMGRLWRHSGDIVGRRVP